MVAAAVIGGAVVGAAGSSIGASKSAKASKSATDATVAEQRRQYDQTRTDTANLRALSDSSVGGLQKLQSGDLSGFYADPGYKFNVEQTQKATDRSLAARGKALSGASVLESQRNATGLASQQYGAFVDRLLQSAGLGNTGIAASASAGMNASNNIGAAYQNNAAIRGSAYMQQAQGINNAAQGAAGNLLLMKYLGTQPSSSPSSWGGA